MASRPNKPIKESNDGKAEKKSGKARLVIIIVAVLLLGGAGGAAAWYYGQLHGYSRAQNPGFRQSGNIYRQSAARAQRSASSDQSDLEDWKMPTAADLIKLHMPEVRNRVLLLLSSKAASQIAAVDGKKKLAAELLAEINQPFSERQPEHAVESVLFTSFVIQ